MAFYLNFEQEIDGKRKDLYPAIAQRAQMFPAPMRGDMERSDGGFEACRMRCATRCLSALDIS